MSADTTPFANDKNIPIQVMNVVDTTGRIIPLSFRYEDPEEHCVRKVTIEKVHSSQTVNYVGCRAEQFVCTADMDGRRHMFELRFFVGTHRWVLFQMLH